MKAFFYLLVIAITTITGCDDGGTATEMISDSTYIPDSVADHDYKSIEPEKAKIFFNLYDRQDNSIEVSYDNNTIYCAAATWCGFTKKLIELMNDPTYKPVVSKFKFVFLFCRTELSDILNQVNNDETMSESDKDTYRTRLKQIFEEQDVFDPTMLSDLPGEYHFFKSNDFNKVINGFPNAYNEYTNAFNVNPIRLMAQLSPQDKNILDQMYQQYAYDDH